MPQGKRVPKGISAGNQTPWDDERRKKLRETLRQKRIDDYDIGDENRILSMSFQTEEERNRALESEYANLKAAVYARAMSGDPQATKAWLDIYENEAPSQAFNVEVSIERYTVADTSLSRIVQYADYPVVDEILKGLDQRFFTDEAPTEIRNHLRVVREQFMEWAETYYAPKG